MKMLIESNIVFIGPKWKDGILKRPTNLTNPFILEVFAYILIYELYV